MPTLPNINSETYAEHLENEYQNLKALVFQYDQAISALLTGKHQSYEINTGQGTQRVTRLDIAEIQTRRDQAAARLHELAVRLGKVAGTHQVVPGW